jgi:DNA-binding MarR family transcriptional regulator
MRDRAGAVALSEPRRSSPREEAEVERLLDLVRDTNASRREILRVAVGRHGRLPTEYRALAQVARGRAKTPTEVSGLLGLTSASTAEVLDRLECRGCPRRSRNPDDRRSTPLELPAPGTRIVRNARGEHRGSLDPALGWMSARGRERLGRGLEEFSRALADDGSSSTR